MTINVELLDRVMAHIEAHPETWDQKTFRCESGMCVAGWAAQLGGGLWLTGPEDNFCHHLVAEEGDPDGDIREWRGTRSVPVWSRAARLLGLDDHEADRLFGPGNTIDDLREIVAGLKAGTS